ncbi:SGNH/GDSL hydrolase family protein [Nocardiopsis ansamitocini]|uniref:SGNH hydrolase-type esterase domain-containing protein n=1 Tax=Nocardiopsis ansamitocini TaxID=1670832 RepID=A0A9W6UGN2_9ACTN|nr:SGNH/GDSL hydrolase family protein [Nocardiopsis ansamitocini]GLU47806.1 hypothetical protein Nans01_21570 [Nocardiopsis ansamitocini]
MRRPAAKRRTLLLGTIAAVLVVAVGATLAVPTSRIAVQQVWCNVTRTWCANVPVDPEDRADGGGWRLHLGPVEAATWGNYYALGDSYSSGDGAGDYLAGTGVQGGCWRSANAYPERLAESYDFAGSLNFLACSGQRGNKLLESLESAESQLDEVTPHTSLVTVGIGGNDLGFTSVLKTCMMRVPLLESGACIGQEDTVAKRMRTFEATFDGVVQEVRDRAPDARIVVVGYPRLFPQEPTGMYYTLTPSDQRWLNKTILGFNKQLREAVAEADAEIADSGQVGSVEFVDAYDALEGHEIGADKPWVNGVLLRDLSRGVAIDRSTFHPNAQGQGAVGELVGAQLAQGPDRPFYATRETVRNASQDVLAAEAR